jgi:hypothetical protein
MYPIDLIMYLRTLQGAANAVASLNKAPETAAAAAAAAAGRLGRPLFCRNAAQAARAGMLGALVKLNLVCVFVCVCVCVLK